MRAYPGTTFEWWTGVHDEQLIATAIDVLTGGDDG